MVVLPSLRASASRVAASSSRRPTRAAFVAVRHSSHGHAHAADGPEEVYPPEGFTKPIWRNGVLLTLAITLAYRLSPSPPKVPAVEGEPEEHPITRFIRSQLTAPAGLWEKNAAKHLALAKEAADDKLLFQEAERPKVRRLRYLGTFDQASPNNIPVGSQADLSGLVIKSEKDDFSFGATPADE